jgi:hypothetical protein
MNEREPFPTEDLEPADEEPESLPADAPEADALEQAQPTTPTDEPRPQRVDDAPEADALEQAEPAGDTDDEERP